MSFNDVFWAVWTVIFLPILFFFCSMPVRLIEKKFNTKIKFHWKVVVFLITFGIYRVFLAEYVSGLLAIFVIGIPFCIILYFVAAIPSPSTGSDLSSYRDEIRLKISSREFDLGWTDPDSEEYSRINDEIEDLKKKL